MEHLDSNRMLNRGRPQQRVVSASQNGLTLGDLLPGTTYNISVAAGDRNGMPLSLHSEVKTIATHVSEFFMIRSTKITCRVSRPLFKPTNAQSKHMTAASLSSPVKCFVVDFLTEKP